MVLGIGIVFNLLSEIMRKKFSLISLGRHVLLLPMALTPFYFDLNPIFIAVYGWFYLLIVSDKNSKATQAFLQVFPLVFLMGPYFGDQSIIDLGGFDNSIFIRDLSNNIALMIVAYLISMIWLLSLGAYFCFSHKKHLLLKLICLVLMKYSIGWGVSFYGLNESILFICSVLPVVVIRRFRMQDVFLTYISFCAAFFYHEVFVLLPVGMVLLKEILNIIKEKVPAYFQEVFPILVCLIIGLAAMVVFKTELSISQKSLALIVFVFFSPRLMTLKKWSEKK